MDARRRRTDPALSCPGLPAHREAASAFQIARRLQLPRCGADTLLALREAGGHALDADPGSGGQRLDVDGGADRDEGRFTVLDEVVAHRTGSPRTGSRFSATR
ncbi:hypothetical protein GCM10011583_27150 [Streptomyces camponoticapitis]|uniref:Uncharacterized protein n=1 Tax=Streptomyces camponoticapitis TaxID=1616125 RepID=A0ABQ2E848_9ACTN|nr:hypothetical protein GCM10011583_27150 [Streptomyces camponoticapitis]